MKAKTLLVAAVLLFGITATAFAQIQGATFTVSSIPVTAVTATGQTERTGDVSFTTIPGSNTTVVGTFTLTYGSNVNITNATASIIGGTNASNTTGPGNQCVDSLGALTNTCVSIGSIVNIPGTVVINVNAGYTGSFSITGVRVSVYNTGLTTMDAQLSSVGNSIVSGQNTVRVISSIKDGLAPISSTPITVNAVDGTKTGGVGGFSQIAVPENYLNAFGQTAASAGAGQNRATGFRVTLDAIPPVGMSLTFPGTVNSVLTSDGETASAAVFQTVADSTFPLAGLGGNVTFDSTSTAPLTVYYMLVSDSDPTANETALIDVTVTITASKLPIAATVINAKVSLAPIGNAFGTNNAIIVTPVPRYAALDLGPVQVVNTTSSNTVMLIPYATTELGFDTGIAIANTTTDPGKANMGNLATARKQSGPIHFYFYSQIPKAGTTLPPAGDVQLSDNTVGSGLDASGNLPSGSTFVVLLSELLAKANLPADFQGYVFAVTSFSNGHGQYFVSNFTTFSNGGQIMVLSDRKSVV